MIFFRLKKILLAAVQPLFLKQTIDFLRKQLIINFV
jgi:hypothetical protein